MTISSTEHVPVLAQELIDLLQLEPQHIVVDLTLGRGGHAKLVIERLSKEGTFIGLDADKRQIEYVSTSMGLINQTHTQTHTPQTHTESQARTVLLHSNFDKVGQVLKSLNIACVDRIYADLGLSSVQLLDEKRGFSFQSSTLDMRLDPSSPHTAEEVVNTLTEADLNEIFEQYGEEREASRIAEAIVTSRKTHPINTAKELSEIVRQAKRNHFKKVHPATQVFQALRIYVNDEFGTLKRMLQQIPQLLCAHGRFAIITFHSLEDRIVKNTFKQWEKDGICKRINKKVVSPQWSERKVNPRARSAHLRIIEKI